MGQKDMTEKILESHNDVFADIVNVLLFNGRQVISPDELKAQSPRDFYKADSKLHEMERDVSKRWKKEGIRLACFGFENQTASDPNMPIRVIGYDGASYFSQMKHDAINICPVITLVLYFGDKPWKGPLSLKQRLAPDEELAPFFKDYDFNLFQIAFLSKEQVSLFRSDFRIVADYFVQMRETGTYTGHPQNLIHIEETLQLLSVMSNNMYETEYMSCTDEQKRGIRNMNDMINKIKAEGKAEGKVEGKVEGEVEGEKKMARLFNKLFDLNRIEDAMRASKNEKYRQQLMKELCIS